jgi:membrane protease YdiL (CAAX protease family)
MEDNAQTWLGRRSPGQDRCEFCSPGGDIIEPQERTLKKYWHVFFALFVLTVAISLDWITGIYIRKNLDVNDGTTAGWALQKLSECFIVASTVITFTLASGGSLGSIYIQKGKLNLGLFIGLISFSIFAISAVPMGSLFNAQDLSLFRILPWNPWLLIIVLANGTLEELLFRGLFLHKLEPFVGKLQSIFLFAFRFTGLHSWVSYTADNRIFLAVTFLLALALGYIMQKTDSLWGSLLLHAGMDIPVMIGIFKNLN